jgi:hypothetical protein
MPHSKEALAPEPCPKVSALPLQGVWRYCLWAQLGGGLLGAGLFYLLAHRLDFALHFFSGALLGLLWLASLMRGTSLAGSKQAKTWQMPLFSLFRLVFTSAALVTLGLGQPLKTVIVLLGFLSYKLCLVLLGFKHFVVARFLAKR